MEFSEEEKKAIEYFKKYINDEEKKLGKNLTTKFNEHLKVLLDKVDKQQKEIEELKEMKPLQDLIDTNIIIADYSHNYISKDKIREKIKEIHNKGTFDAEIVLTKLLEENNEKSNTL